MITQADQSVVEGAVQVYAERDAVGDGVDAEFCVGLNVDGFDQRKGWFYFESGNTTGIIVQIHNFCFEFPVADEAFCLSCFFYDT